MKELRYFLLAVVMAATIGLGGSAKAQASKDDGIAASPRMRQFLNERKAAAAAVASKKVTGAVFGEQVVATKPIAASPRVQQKLDRGAASTSTPVLTTDRVSVGYRATGPDGITASPKMREQLNQRGTVIMVAPVK